MESVCASHARSCQLFSKFASVDRCLRPFAQVGFGFLSRQTCKNGSLRLVRSSRSGFVSDSQDGSSAVENGKEEEKGLILGTERDASGSVIGFNLISQSQSGMFKR